jgi:hypothetical protein
MPSHVSTPSDASAREALAMARLQALNAMFTGTKLKFGAKGAVSAVSGIANSGRTIASDAKKLAKGATTAAGSATNSSSTIAMVNDFITGCADVPGLHAVVDAIGTEAMENLVAEVVPFVSIVNSARKLATATARVVDDAHSLYKSAEWTGGALPGDPVAACEAVKSLIKRDLGKHSIQMAQQAAATGGKLAGILGDGGTGTTVAIGLANAAATLGLQLFYLGLDIKDLRAGNARLAKPNGLDSTVFNECPILGCYLLTCTDTSNIVNLLVEDIGSPGWMSRVEVMKRTQLDPLLKIATKNITSSRLQLEGLASNKGTFAQPTFFSSIKSKALAKLGYKTAGSFVRTS